VSGGSTPAPTTAATSGEAVALCVVSHDDAADLPLCLTAISEIGHRPLEVVVADCASADDSLAVVAGIARPCVPRGCS
jgi:GT2 family glycosyltransferase